MLESLEVGERINLYDAQVREIGLLLLFPYCSKEKGNEECFVAVCVEINRVLSKL